VAGSGPLTSGSAVVRGPVTSIRNLQKNIACMKTLHRR
jgi:hypothetical protein